MCPTTDVADSPSNTRDWKVLRLDTQRGFGFLTSGWYVTNDITIFTPVSNNQATTADTVVVLSVSQDVDEYTISVTGAACTLRLLASPQSLFYNKVVYFDCTGLTGGESVNATFSIQAGGESCGGTQVGQPGRRCAQLNVARCHTQQLAQHIYAKLCVRLESQQLSH